jgi:hypothetical protein
MQTWKFGWTVVSLVALGSAAGCGDDDGGDDPEGPEGTGGSPAGGEGGAAGAFECSTIRNFVPLAGDDDGPACEAYAECMDEGCGELYEVAFGPDWASGDLSGGACGPSVPCLEGCGCEQVCLTGCLAAALPCAPYALQFQTCYEACATESNACQAERAP